MQRTIAVAYYPEGAGHATRMTAIAQALERRGAAVRLAGGGDGSRFVALNGYDEFEPTPVDYIDTYQGDSPHRVLTESVPATAARIRDYVGWLRETAPDALVTDDMFAAMAAARVGTPLYVLKHDLPSLYADPIARAGAAFHTRFQRSTARTFFFPTVRPDSDIAPDDVVRVPPVALAGDATPPDPAPDVVCVPSHFSSFDRVADRLGRDGYDVVNVGDDDWEPVASLLPALRAADVVVCSGYSTIMDAAVAGTPCIVRPATDEQRAVADWLDGAAGFAVAADALAVLDAVDDPPAAPAFDNGAGEIAARVLDDVTPGDATTDGLLGGSRRLLASLGARAPL